LARDGVAGLAETAAKSGESALTTAARRVFQTRSSAERARLDRVMTRRVTKAKPKPTDATRVVTG